MQLFRVQKAAVLQSRDGVDPACGTGVQHVAPGQVVVQDGQPALAGGQTGPTVRRVLEKLESSSTTLSGQIQSTVWVKVVEVKKTKPRKCSTCKRVHNKCTKCQQVHSCMIECHNCKKAEHISQR